MKSARITLQLICLTCGKEFHTTTLPYLLKANKHKKHCSNTCVNVKHKTVKEKHDANRERHKKWRDNNRTQLREKQSLWREINREQIRNEGYLRHYGITLIEYQELFAVQKGCCKLCGINQEELKRPLCVDHCHTTKVVRGLLCDPCNRGLGLLKDNIITLKNAVEYLELKSNN